METAAYILLAVLVLVPFFVGVFMKFGDKQTPGVEEIRQGMDELSRILSEGEGPTLEQRVAQLERMVHGVVEAVESHNRDFSQSQGSVTMEGDGQDPWPGTGAD